MRAGHPPPRFLTEYRRTSAPGRLLIGLSSGTYPILPILVLLSLAVPLLVLPIAWAFRKLRRRDKTAKAVPLAELISWIAVATALGALAHLARTLLAWAGGHSIALPAAVSPAVVVSAGIAGIASLLAVVGLWIALRSSRAKGQTTSLLLACWAALACAGSLAWIIYLI